MEVIVINSCYITRLLWGKPRKQECKKKVAGSMKSKLRALQRLKKGKSLKKKKKKRGNSQKAREKDHTAFYVSLASSSTLKKPELETGDGVLMGIVYLKKKKKVEF